MTGNDHRTTKLAEPCRRASWRAAALVVLATMAVVVVPATATSASPRTTRADALIVPTISVTPGPPMIAPGFAKGTATITGTSTLTGNLVLSLYSPAAPGCTGSPIASVSATIVNGTGTGTVTLIRNIRATDPSGLWHWQASYAGNATHAAATSACTEQLILQLVPSQWQPFSSPAELVTQQYLDFLGRIPTATELTTWVSKLSDRLVDAGDVVAALRQDPDQRNNVDPAVRLYRAYFLRSPDASGLRYWIAQRRTGRSLAAISEFFAHSSEFQHRYGSLDNDAFVALIYQNILGRPGEQGGVSYWTDQLDRRLRNRGSVMIGFSESPEYIRAQSSEVTVAVLYVLMLGRAPTAAEFAATVDLLDVGATSPFPFGAAELAKDLMARGEYVSHV